MAILEHLRNAILAEQQPAEAAPVVPAPAPAPNAFQQAHPVMSQMGNYLHTPNTAQQQLIAAANQQHPVMAQQAQLQQYTPIQYHALSHLLKQ